jgi:tetratricopeptide (TPR) repeat protein
MRTVVRIALVTVLCTLPPLWIFAQETEKVLRTSVSKLDAELKNGFIRISWTDSPDIQGPVYVYRSTTPFPAAPSASLPYPVAVPYGVQSYVDEADRPGTYFYFAAASDDKGKKYTSVILYDNTLSVTVGREDVSGYGYSPAHIQEFPGPRPVETFFTGPDTGIRELRAAVEGDRIRLTFLGNGKNAVLYRSTRPMRTREDLIQAVIISRASTPPLVDYPVPGIPYFYALVLEEELTSGYVPLKAGSNVTANPTEVPPSPNRPGFSGDERRVRPLPVPDMADAAQAPPAMPLSEDALKALDAAGFFGSGKPQTEEALRTGYQTPQKPFREPDIFLEDLEAQAAGEQAHLRIIVQGSFSGQNWEKAADELQRFLSLPHSAQVTSRARFYLGQVYYFKGMPQEALFEFLAAQTLYPNESNPWIDTVLARLAN